MLRFRHIIGVCVFVCMAAAVAPADEARKVFDTLYGQKIRQATATADRADDVALAQEMVAVAKDSGGTPGLQILLCNGAADLAGKHPDGYAVAIEAMQLLADEREEEREAARAKLIELLAKQSRTGGAEARNDAGDALIDLLITMGDEKAERKLYTEAAADYRRANTLAVQRKSEQLEPIKAKMEFATSRDRTVKRLAQLQEKLLQNANDHATAEEIVRLYVVELDDPAGAAPYLNRVKDEQLKELVPLAVATERLTDAQCLLLGEWYRAQSARLNGAAARPPLERAAKLFSRYLETGGGPALEKTKAEIFLKEIRNELAKLAPKSPTPRTATTKTPAVVPEWTVRCWEGTWNPYALSKMETKNTPAGFVVRNTSGIHRFAKICYGDALDGDFDFEIEVRGANSVHLTPANGEDAGIYVHLPNRGDSHRVRLSRRKDEIKGLLNGKPVDLDFRSGNRGLKGYMSVEINSNETVTIRAVKLVVPAPQ